MEKNLLMLSRLSLFKIDYFPPHSLSGHTLAHPHAPPPPHRFSKVVESLLSACQKCLFVIIIRDRLSSNTCGARVPCSTSC